VLFVPVAGVGGDRLRQVIDARPLELSECIARIRKPAAALD
jgi:hypothetical protein